MVLIYAITLRLNPHRLWGKKWWESQFRTVPFSVFPCRVVPWSPLCMGTAATQVGWPESALRPLLSQDQYTITPFWAMAHHFVICICSLSAKDSYSSTFMHFLTYSSLKNGYTQGDAYIYSICRRTSLQTYHVFINAHTCLQAWPQQPGGKKRSIEYWTCLATLIELEFNAHQRLYDNLPYMKFSFLYCK